jgi:hypothetical protein
MQLLEAVETVYEQIAECLWSTTYEDNLTIQ